MKRTGHSRRRFLKTGLAGAAGFTLAGCVGGGGGGDGDIEVSDEAEAKAAELPDYYPDDYAETIQGAMNEGEVTLYVAHFGSFSDSYVEAFNQRFPFIDVEVVNLPTAKVFERFSAEASQDRWEPDVVHTYDAVALNRLKQLDILQNYESPEEEFIRDEWKSDDGMVVGPNFNPYSHAWHPPEISDPPMTLPDVANAVQSDVEGWKGNLCMYDGVLSTSMWQMMLIWERHYGRDEMEGYLKDIAPAEPKAFWSTSTMGEWVATGEVKYGLNLAQFILARYVRPDFGEQDLLWGPDEDVIFPAYFGGFVMPKEVDNADAAKVWYDWWISKEGQAFLTNEWRYVSARTDLDDVIEATYRLGDGTEVPMTYDDISELTPFINTYQDLATAGEKKEELKNLWYEIFVAGV